jgi:putative FmdB family regulatory protein
MPFYEYKCDECGKEYEELVPMQAKEAPPCPACGSKQVERKISLFGSMGSGKSSCGSSGFS